MLHLWYSSIYTEGLDSEVRFPRQRYQLVRSGLELARKNGAIFFHEPETIAKEELYLAHCPNYVNRFFHGQLEEKEIRRIGLKPWTELMVERTCVLTNGTVCATRKVLESSDRKNWIAGNMGGGTHHAYYDFGSGYCIVNDLAISARIAQRDYGIKNILILDLDVHQGDGTAAIFENDSTVRTVSIHCQANFPFRKMRSDLDIGLANDLDDKAYLSELNQLLKSEMNHHPAPELLFFQAGVDVLTTDRLGHLSLTPQGVTERNRLVFEFARQLRVPIVLTMGGGYGEPIGTSIDAHINLFEMAAQMM